MFSSKFFVLAAAAAASLVGLVQASPMPHHNNNKPWVQHQDSLKVEYCGPHNFNQWDCETRTFEPYECTNIDGAYNGRIELFKPLDADVTCKVFERYNCGGHYTKVSGPSGTSDIADSNHASNSFSCWTN